MSDNKTIVNISETKLSEIKSQINLSDTTSILSFGAAAQRKSSEFVDSILKSTKTKDFGETGNMLSELVLSIKSFGTDTESKNILLRLFSSAKGRIEKLHKSYAKAETTIDGIVEGLEKHRMMLMQDIAMLDTMYERNIEYLGELDTYITAGEQKINEVVSNELPKLKENAEKGDQLAAQKFNDAANSVERFEKKLHDLKLTKTVSMQMLPQIRLQQANNSVLVDKIHSSIVNSIPLWKSQMIIALGLSHTQKALQAQKAVTDVTNEMLRKNSEMLKTGTIEVAKESERSIVDIETIKKANDDIVYAIQQVSAIQAEARQKRIEAEKEIERLGQELKNNVIAALGVNK